MLGHYSIEVDMSNSMRTRAPEADHTSRRPAAAQPPLPVALVMTATIRPQADAVALARKDPALRLEDYCAALRFYLGLPDALVDRIVFIENSASDLSALQRIVDTETHAKQVELLTFQGNDFPPSFGRGYGEFQLLNHGLAQSASLRRGDLFWKVTGRLQVRNLDELIRTAPQEYDLYCDVRDVPLVGQIFGGNPWLELRLFSATRAGYDQFFRPQADRLRRDKVGTPERYLFHQLKNYPDPLRIIRRFRVQPQYVGFAGHSNRDYASLPDRAKNSVRSVTRKWLPWIWI
jgi:hypothetical protein